MYKHFLLYYGCDIPKMKAHMKAKEKAEKAAAGEDGGDGGVADDHDDDTLKQATRKSAYAMCVKAGLCECHTLSPMCPLPAQALCPLSALDQSSHFGNTTICSQTA